MKVAAKERVWTAPQPRATYESDGRYLLGCSGCKSTCCTADPCKCCRAYKTRSAGGSVNYAIGAHSQIMTTADFRRLYESEAVA